MLTCLNIESVEFQTKLKLSGLPIDDFKIAVYSSFYKQLDQGVLEKDLRYPELDEINGADSSKYLSEQILLKNNGTKISNILNYTLTSSIEEAIIELNNIHKDLEITVIPLNEEALVLINHKPSNLTKISESVNINADKQALIPLFYKLANLYGIKFNTVTLAELTSDPKFKDVFDAKHVNAFILNNEIYINMDIANIDAPIHELSHILIGGLKNNNLYQDLCKLVEQLPNYQALVNNYPNRTRNDINEEIFVTEVSKYLTNLKSYIHDLPLYVLLEIITNIHRLLDSMLMGDMSVKNIMEKKLGSMSLPKIASIVNSDIFDNLSESILNRANLHRVLNNVKSDLMKNNELIENCQ